MLRVGGSKRVEAVVVRVQDGCVGLHLLDSLPELLPHGVAPNREDGQDADSEEQRSIAGHGRETTARGTGWSTAIASGIPAGPNTNDTPAPGPGQPDYYFENGLLVYTAAYHLKRGHCCGSGCRHCPYEPRHVEGTTKVPA